MNNREQVLKVITEAKRITTVDVIAKCPDIWPSSVRNTLHNLKRDKIIKVVAKRKVKNVTGSIHVTKCSVYELCSADK